MKKRLSKTSKDLIVAFDIWAKALATEGAIGYGSSVDRVEKCYNESKEALIQRIIKLEETIKVLKSY